MIGGYPTPAAIEQDLVLHTELSEASEKRLVWISGSVSFLQLQLPGGLDSSSSRPGGPSPEPQRNDAYPRGIAQGGL